MAKKDKKNQDMETINNEIINNKEEKQILDKTGFRITLKTKNFIIIDKYGINVKINLPMQELVKYQVNDLYYP